MGFNLDQAPTWTVGFGEVSPVKVETENCICGGNEPEPGEGSTFYLWRTAPGADWEWGAYMVCDPTGQRQDNECFEEGHLN